MKRNSYLTAVFVIVRDVCDIGQALFGGSKWAYNATAVFFLLNNTFIQGELFISCSFYPC